MRSIYWTDPQINPKYRHLIHEYKEFYFITSTFKSELLSEIGILFLHLSCLVNIPCTSLELNKISCKVLTSILSTTPLPRSNGNNRNKSTSGSPVASSGTELQSQPVPTHQTPQQYQMPNNHHLLLSSLQIPIPGHWGRTCGWLSKNGRRTDVRNKSNNRLRVAEKHENQECVVI